MPSTRAYGAADPHEPGATTTRSWCWMECVVSSTAKVIAFADIWGVRYKGDLYRVVKLGRYYQDKGISNVLVVLEAGGLDKLCYYE